MKNRIIALLAALVLCVSLTGCAMLNEFVQKKLEEGLSDALSDMLDSGDAAASHAPSVPESSAATPPVASSAITSEPQGGLTYNDALFSLVNATNAEVKYALDSQANCQSEIAFGGTPVVTYEITDGAYMSVWLEAEYDELMRAWEEADRSNSQGLPTYNCFPDSYPVDKIYLGGDEIILRLLFEGEDEITPDTIAACLGQSPEVEIIPAETGEGMEMGPLEDMVEYTFSTQRGDIILTYTRADNTFASLELD